MKSSKSVSVQVFDSDIAYLLPNVSVPDSRQMESRSSRLKQACILVLGMCIFGIFGLGYYCPDKVCALSPAQTLRIENNIGKPLRRVSSKAGLSYDDMLNEDFSFDMDSHDVMVFLHMQKTGGTSFGKHLVQDLDLKRPCTCPISRKRCHCFRPHSNQSWLFSRYTTGWKCGLHADWTELTSCVDRKLDELEEVVKRRYFYVTLLREPISRYLSEFRHVQRGATWRGSRHFCKGRPVTEKELPPCYEGENWGGVELDEFIACKSNLAANRQTRMLADLELIGCYDQSYMPKQDRDRIMLASAKKNLQSMAFFGLTEYQKISQYIFEETFNLRFSIPFEQNNSTVSSSTITTLTPEQTARIAELNSLDIELYNFAKKLLFERFEQLKAKDVDFNERFKHLGELVIRNSPTDFDWDKFDDSTDTYD
ncbi:unnamed protein product [Callosobruchus maculatus]|uniref:Heparan-sulfate 6-O-sulfotransferase n=1 Tax=Callosobruchus maculatus TaxID=64391 RepID=A0A653BF44_CALMS|nr:unnamed protein product [Callosobruchus maculatus]